MNEHQAHHNAVIEGSSDRNFGLVFTIFFLVVALLPLLHGDGLRLWAIGLSGLFFTLVLAAPQWLSPFNRLWTRLGVLLHSIIGPVALGIVFYGVIMPIGLIMRLLGKDLLRLRPNKSSSSYWIDRRPAGPAPESLKLPF